jgi:hypothetical protein
MEMVSFRRYTSKPYEPSIFQTRRFDNELPIPKLYSAETYYVPGENDATAVRSSFAHPVREQVSRKLPDYEQTSPGMYNPQLPASNTTGAKNCFNSNTKRFFDTLTDKSTTSVPGPGIQRFKSILTIRKILPRAF